MLIDLADIVYMSVNLNGTRSNIITSADAVKEQMETTVLPLDNAVYLSVCGKSVSVHTYHSYFELLILLLLMLPSMGSSTTNQDSAA